MNSIYKKEHKEYKKRANDIRKYLKSKKIEDEKITEIYEYMQELIDELKAYQIITVMEFERPYAKRYLKEQKKKWKKENPERAKKGEGLLYPDSESIYRDYYKLLEETRKERKK